MRAPPDCGIPITEVDLTRSRQADRRVAIACPGGFATPTGGTLYDARLASELEHLGWRVERIALPPGFPDPSAQDLRQTAALLRGSRHSAPVIVDGLALGAMPEVACHLKHEIGIVALVHHPLAFETGLSAQRASALMASERQALRCVELVITTSKTTRTTLIERFDVPANRIVVAPPGTDPRPLGMGSGEGVLHILNVGAVVPRKDQILLIEALARLREMPWRVTIAGPHNRAPAYRDAVVQTIRRHGLKDRVALAGALTREALDDLYGCADLFVSAARYEGYGMALAEAVAAGLPVVAARGGAVPEWLEVGAARLFPPGDGAALSDILEELLSEPMKRARLRAGARELRGRLPTWPATAATVARALERLQAGSVS